MADITHLFGGPLRPEPQRQPAPPEEQLRDAIAAAGISPPDTITLDGRLRRFASGTKGHGTKISKAGWYVAFGDGVPAGRFGCWRAGIEQSWVADVGRELSDAERMAHLRRMAEAQAARDAELARTRQTAAEEVAGIWEAASGASPDHPYFARKGIQPHGARVAPDGRLIVPLYSPDLHLSSIQYIAHDGGKLYHSGGQTGGCFTILGTPDPSAPIYIAEGYATAATVHEATGRACAVAYSASNLVPVTGTLRERYGATASLVIVADNDKSGVGQRYAEQASAKHGARVVMMPPELCDANDFRAAGGDLLALLEPPADPTWLIPADEFSAQPAPVRWLVKRWVQANALVMVHGPSGGGKTFVVIDWCLRIASATGEWAGYRVTPAAVVYLAGEGHHGLRGRLAAWKHYHGVTTLDAWVSSSGCDLDTPHGFARASEAIRALPHPPALIVVDTLHRFLSGDENNAKDVKPMLDACAALGRMFGATVLLVHHTGVSDEAQHRARGSSAWRGALDIEISIIPPKTPGDPIRIEQRKAKDSELAAPVFCELRQVELPGWLDEDGEQVASAVTVVVDAPPEAAKREPKLDGFRKTFERAWWASGQETTPDGLAYVTRAAMLALLESDGMSPRTAENHTKPGDPSKTVGALLNAEIISPCRDGWVISSPTDAQALSLLGK